MARHPLVRRPLARRSFVAFAAPRVQDRVLDVACGPGFNALAFARRTGEVIGVDSAPELLAQAQSEAARRRLSNVSFQEGAPAVLLFPDDSFDIVTSTGVLHHFPSLESTLAEMARVCLPDGKIVLEDIVAAEQDMRARYHNRLERLRDRSHVRFLKLSELVSSLGQAGLVVRRIEVRETLREFNEWIAIAGTPPARAEHILRLLIGSIAGDLSGLSVHQLDDTIIFSQRRAWVLATKVH